MLQIILESVPPRKDTQNTLFVYSRHEPLKNYDDDDDHDDDVQLSPRCYHY